MVHDATNFILLCMPNTMHAKTKLTVSSPAQHAPAVPLTLPRYVTSLILSYYACQTETNSVSPCTVQYACPSRSIIPSTVRSIANSILPCMPDRNERRLLLHRPWPFYNYIFSYNPLLCFYPLQMIKWLATLVYLHWFCFNWFQLDLFFYLQNM